MTLRTIKLSGELGKKFGRVHKAHVSSVGEALRYLDANFSKFRKHLEERKIAGYEVWDGNYNLEGKNDEFVKEGSGEIRIIPRVSGSGAAARIIIGVVLVVVGYLASPFTGGASLYLIPVGLSLIVGGVTELMSKNHRQETGQEPLKDSSSYIFSGPVNNARTGAPVPIGYGEMIVGSQVISASIVTNNIPV